jgi:hypothetical protein
MTLHNLLNPPDIFCFVGPNISHNSSFSNTLNVCMTWGSHGGKYEDGCLLRSYAVQSGRSSPTFQSCLLPSSLERAIFIPAAVRTWNFILNVCSSVRERDQLSQSSKKGKIRISYNFYLDSGHETKRVHKHTFSGHRVPEQFVSKRETATRGKATFNFIDVH